MDEARTALHEELGRIEPLSGAVPFFSTVTGDWRGPARSTRVLVPQPPARPSASPPPYGRSWSRDTAPSSNSAPTRCSPPPSGETGRGRGGGPTTVGTVRRGHGGPEDFARSLGAAWAAGVPDPLGLGVLGVPARPVPLPTSPFEPERFWWEPAPDTATATGPGAAARDAADALRYRIDWERTLPRRGPPPTASTTGSSSATKAQPKRSPTPRAPPRSGRRDGGGPRALDTDGTDRADRAGDADNTDRAAAWTGRT
ncbi:hypothetical protein [Streptomyces sp. KL116D]|uniref:hypothetical protein n=1 Tax=Streptomyces sp. KL116D TaxID=3045152 RepID=UPI0035590EDC